MELLSPHNLDQALAALAAFLEDAGAPHETLVVIGGSALISLFPEIVRTALTDLGYGHLVARF